MRPNRDKSVHDNGCIRIGLLIAFRPINSATHSFTALLSSFQLVDDSLKLALQITISRLSLCVMYLIVRKNSRGISACQLFVLMQS